MVGYILRRLVIAIPVLLIVGVIVFSLVHVTPGDPASVILGPDATDEQIQNLREDMGLTQPLLEQFVDWFGGVIRLDFGQSFYLNMPVTHALFDRAEITLLLTIYSLLIAIIIGLPIGIIAAVRSNSLLDRVLMVISLSGAAIPNFFLGILLIMFFAVTLQWLPSGGYTSITADVGEHFKSMIMPAIALGFSEAALLARMVRSSMLDILRDDFIRTAWAKGLRQRSVIMGHALRNVLIPSVTVLGFALGALLGGAVVTETVFTLPGMGRLVVQSVERRDFPVIQGAVMLIAMIYILVNLLVDILYVFLDPRIRYGGK